MTRSSGLVILACHLLAGQAARAQSPIPEDTARVLRQSVFSNPALRESSALVASRQQPGLLWTLNDSGNPAELFATDTSGRDLGTFRVPGAGNRDWEAMALGACGQRDCLYIGDTGDNSQRRRTIRIYRVPEPDRRSRRAASNGMLDFRFEDGPRNVEAMFVTGNQDIYLISKERSGGGRVYRVEGESWDRPDAVATAHFIQDLAFPDGLGYQVTDAALAPNGVDVAVRTYRYIFFFALREGRLAPSGRKRCDAGGVDAIGEGIAWLNGNRLATSSERLVALGGTISVLECN